MATTGDILLSDTYEFLLEKGDFRVGDGTEQHLGLVCLLEKGELKFAPTLGAGIRTQILNEISDISIKQEIQKNLEIDGCNVVSIEIENEKYKVKGYY